METGNVKKIHFMYFSCVLFYYDRNLFCKINVYKCPVHRAYVAPQYGVVQPPCAAV